MAALDTSRTEVRAEARYVRAAPRKAQLVTEQIRGRTVPEARTILAFMTRDAARDVERVLNSAVANAEANHGLVGDDLLVSAAYAGDGPTLKRWRARARGRVARIRRRTCHITIRLAQPNGAELPAAHAPVAPDAPPNEERPTRGARPPSSTPRRRGQKPEVAETTEPVEKAEDKPKTRPKRAEKPKAETDAGEKPKRTPRRRKTEKEES